MRSGQPLGDRRGTSLMMARSTPRKIGAHQGRFSAVAAEELDDGDPLVGSRGGAKCVDEVDAAGDGRGKTDAVIGAEDVVVHGLGDGENGKAFLVEPDGIAQRIVASDGHQGVHAQDFQVFEDMGGKVPFLFGPGKGVLEKVRGFLVADGPRVGSGRVEVGASRGAGRHSSTYRRLRWPPGCPRPRLPGF